MERGKNLSKRFRKSCRNWATSKGLLNNNTKEDTHEKKEDNETTDVDNEDNDIVVIDLEEDPELKYKAASETDIGQLVADLVRDARRNNTLPRSRSRAATEIQDPQVSSLNKSLSAISIADNDDTTQAQIYKVASPSILNNETEEEDQVKTNDEDTKSTTSAEVLETSFDETILTPPTFEERDQEPDESIGESSFYNGIMQATEFLVTAKFSKELFKEETTSSLESSQVDQDGFTDLNKVNTELDENCERKEGNDNNQPEEEDSNIHEPDNDEGSNLDGDNQLEENCERKEGNDDNQAEEEDMNIHEPADDDGSNLDEKRENNGEENESDADKTDTNQLIGQLEPAENNENTQESVENTDSIESYREENNDRSEESDDRDTVTESDEDTECEEENQDFFKETGNIVRSQLIDEDEEEEGFGSDLHSRGLLDDDSDNEFESIAKISALDFLNDEDDADEVTGIVTNGSTNYFSSSFLFNHPVFTKESSFPSLKLDKEDNNSSSPYLEAINLELDGKQETQWNPFRYSSVELRVNPMYKDEDSLNSNNSMNNSLISTDGKIQQFNNNLQEFFDLWETLSKDQDDEETTIMTHQESNCSLLFHNLEAIQEEDESEEDSEIDENNNTCDYSDSETDEEIAEFIMSENMVTVCDTPKHDLIVFTKNNHENRVDRELCNSEGYPDIFKIDPDLFEYVHVKEQSYQSVELENYIGELLKSILDKVLEPEGNEKMIVEDSGSLIDEFDDEYYSCDSPDDLRSEPGSGVSTDEGIDATDDDEDDIEHKNNQYNHKHIDIVRNSPTQL